MNNLAGVITEKFILADPSAAAKALETLATHEIILLTKNLKAHVLVTCLNQMDAPKAAAVLRRLPLKQSAYVLTHLDVPQAARIWKEFSSPHQERLKSSLEEAFLALLTEAGNFPVGSVGHFMKTDFVALKTDAKTGLLVERLKTLPRTKLPHLCFIIGKDNELKGIIRSAELAFYGKETVCGSVMTPCKTLLPTDTLEHAKEVFERTQTDCLPVVNEKTVLLGFIEKYALAKSEPKKSFWANLTK